MIRSNRFVVIALLAIAMFAAQAQEKGRTTDPLALEASAPVATQAGWDGRVFVEGSLGDQSRRHGLDSGSVARLSVDVTRRFRFGGDWRATLSDRLDVQDPPSNAARERVLNSLREAFVGWGSEDGLRIVEFGRINLRHGPAYGYNPTDFFRAGALRNTTTADPIALRENRLGSVMLRGQYVAGEHALALAVAPKLDDAPDGRSFSLDLGATNASDRILATWSSRFGERLNAQVLLFRERGKGSQVGINATSLLGDSVIAFGELARGRGIVAGSGSVSTGTQYALGVTLTLPGKVSLTVEGSRNGRGVGEQTWRRLQAGGPVSMGALLASNQARQDQWAERAWTFYLTQQGWIVRQLDVTGALRINAVDRSRLGWLEVRHHWASVDVAFQYQWTSGEALSEYGLNPIRRSLNALLSVYF